MLVKQNRKDNLKILHKIMPKGLDMVTIFTVNI